MYVHSGYKLKCVHSFIEFIIVDIRQMAPQLENGHANAVSDIQYCEWTTLQYDWPYNLLICNWS